MRPIDADVLKEDLTRFYAGEVTAKKLIDEQPTVGGWISVKDRLPEESGECLAFCKTGYQNVLNYSTRHEAFNAQDTEEEPLHEIEVTHWMPLPEPPKEEV